MREIETLLVDAREQVYTALAEMQTAQPYSLHSSYPKGTPEHPVVTWAEYSNVATDCPVVDELVFQIDLWTRDRAGQPGTERTDKVHNLRKTGINVLK